MLYYNFKGVQFMNTNIKLFNAPAPLKFSIISNPEETYEYFNNVLDFISENKSNDIKICFNLANVSHLSIDAILYILTIAIDIKNLNTQSLNYYIIMPKKKKLKKFLEGCGLYNYLKAETFLESNNYTGIIHGFKIKRAEAVKLCEFVKNNSKISEAAYKELYVLIVELMINTFDHASYEEKNFTIKKEWYVYGETSGNKLELYFLDTGCGIPTTIKKKYNHLINDDDKDSDLLCKAINGEFQINGRGNGLPHIYTFFNIDDHISKIDLFSGNGMLMLTNIFEKNKNSRIFKYDYGNKMYGTLIHLVIDK